MTHNTQLENYLVRLERALGPIPISDKAEIITEIKSHVMDALESGTDKTLTEILSSLGEPEQVANRYLMERGFEPLKAPKHPIVKWLVIGFLGTFAMSVLTLFILIWKFSPLVKVDERSGRVQILGGLIDINEKKGKIKLGNGEGNFSFSLSELSGEKDLVKNNIAKVRLASKNGEFTIEASESNFFKYDCDIEGESKVTNDGDELFVDFSQGHHANCNLKVPARIDLDFNIINGDISLSGLENNVNVELLNGDIHFIEKKNTDYKFDVDLKNGESRDFINSKNENSYNIKMKVQNGSIN